MESKQKPVSVFQGDGICISRILARESSVGESSRIFYRSAQGVPFRWEMQPGTPKNPQEDEQVIPPICPSPLMQSLGLPLPNLDHDEPSPKTSKIKRLKQMVKKRINDHILGRRYKQQESSSSNLVEDVSMVHDPFCCSPWNSQAILDEGNTRIYYCSQHKKAFAVEEDDLFLSRILSGVSAAEQLSGQLHSETSPAGIPLGWEIHPGTPKCPPENELIPPPSPPPAVQNLALPRHKPDEDMKPALKKGLLWIKRYVKKKESKTMQRTISFRYHGEIDEELNGSLRKSDSVSSVSRINKRHYVGGFLSRRDVLVFARTKWKSFTSS